MSATNCLVETVERIPLVGYAAAATHAATGHADLAVRAASNCTHATATALVVVTGSVVTAAGKFKIT